MLDFSRDSAKKNGVWQSFALLVVLVLTGSAMSHQSDGSAKVGNAGNVGIVIIWPKASKSAAAGK
jgi:hypothetical protein